MTPRITYDEHRRGTRFIATIYLQDADGDPKDVTGFAFSCQGAAYTGSDVSLGALTVTIVDGPGGQIEVEWTSADTLDAILDHVPTVEFSLLSIDLDGNTIEEAVLVLPLLAQLPS